MIEISATKLKKSAANGRCGQGIRETFQLALLGAKASFDRQKRIRRSHSRYRPTSTDFDQLKARNGLARHLNRSPSCPISITLPSSMLAAMNAALAITRYPEKISDDITIEAMVPLANIFGQG